MIAVVRRRRVAMASQHQLVSGPYCRSHTDRYVTQAAQLKLLVASLEITGNTRVRTHANDTSSDQVA